MAENGEGAAAAGSQDGGAGGAAAGGDQGAAQANESLDAVIGAYRDRVKTLPGVIPELIQGKTLKEVDASLEQAQAAFKRVADQTAAGAAGGQTAGAGAGAAGGSAVGSGAAAGAAGGDKKFIAGDGGLSKIMAGLEKKGQSR